MSTGRIGAEICGWGLDIAEYLNIYVPPVVIFLVRSLVPFLAMKDVLARHAFAPAAEDESEQQWLIDGAAASLYRDFTYLCIYCAWHPSFLSENKVHSDWDQPAKI